AGADLPELGEEEERRGARHQPPEDPGAGRLRRPAHGGREHHRGRGERARDRGRASAAPTPQGEELQDRGQGEERERDREDRVAAGVGKRNGGHPGSKWTPRIAISTRTVPAPGCALPRRSRGARASLEETDPF